MEFQRALASRDSGLEILKNSKVDTNKYFNWVAEYLYYFDTSLDNNVVNKISNKRLMLVPKGAKKPKIFQAKWLIKDMIYSNSVKAFYARPTNFQTN